MNKMGWMKVLDGTEKIRNRAVREAFSAQTLNCGDNQFNTGGNLEN